MCDPVSISIAALGLGVVGAGTSFAGQMQQAHTQSEQAKTNAAAAADSNKQQQAQIASDFWNKRNQQVQEQSQRQIQTEEAAARARVSAGEGGVSGLVLDSLLNNINGAAGTNNAIAQRNLEITATDTDNARKNAYAQALDRARSVPMGVTPSPITPLLQIANSGLQAGLLYTSLTPPKYTGGSNASVSGGDHSV